MIEAPEATVDPTRVDAVAHARMILYGYLASELCVVRGDGTVNGLPPAYGNLQPCQTSSQAVEAFRARHRPGNDRRLNVEKTGVIQDSSVLVVCIVALIIFSAVAIGGQF
jgi:hypothetical protein